MLDRLPSSRLNISNFLDISDPNTFPRAFLDGTIGGDYAPQHTSDLVRWPLLLKYGGVYADAGMLQIGDLDRLWRSTVGDPNSPYEVLSYNAGPGTQYSLCNYFLCSRPNNPLFLRCHKLLLKLWAADGGKDSTDGMHASPLLKGLPMMMANDPSLVIKEEGKPTLGPEVVSKMLTDYIIQGQVMNLVMRLVDTEDGWNGPEYTCKHVYAPDYMVGSQLINDMTAWDGNKAYKLMSLSMPKEGEEESAEQKEARLIVESCLQKSFGFKLAHGIIIKVYGQTLGSLWRSNVGSDIVPGTYAAWLRYGIVHWNQDNVLPTTKFEMVEPYKIGPLLRDA